MGNSVGSISGLCNNLSSVIHLVYQLHNIYFIQYILYIYVCEFYISTREPWFDRSGHSICNFACNLISQVRGTQTTVKGQARARS